jgi:hypothetical protein
VGVPVQTPPSVEKRQLNVLGSRSLIEEYVAAVHDTMRTLHNRCGCTIDNPCAYCIRRMKAEAELLRMVGREFRPTFA